MSTERTVAWMRQNTAPKIEYGFVSNGGVKPVTTFADLGNEYVVGPPVYDNGMFFVVDTVADCEWTVCISEGSTVVRLRRTTDKYEAIRWADEFKETAQS
jgi:hypothetical protein